MRARTFAIVLALGACSVSEKHPSGNIDGGDIDAAVDAPGDIDANPNDVTGTSTLTHYVAAANGTSFTTTTSMEDLSIYTYAAYVPDATQSTGFRIINGEVTGPGTMRIRDVPQGPYYLSVLLSGTNAPTLYYTDDRVLDLSFGTCGRPGLPDVSLPSTINPMLTGMDRAYDSDFFSLHSLGTGTEHYPIALGNGRPVGNVGTFTSAFEWTSGYGWALPRMRPKLLQNDDVEILHHRNTLTPDPNSVETNTVDQLIELATVTGLTQTDGVALAVNGAFTDVTLDKSVAVNVDMAPLRQAYAATVPHAIEVVDASLGALAGLDPYNGFGPGLVGLNVTALKPSTTAVNRMLSYGNPYDTTWPVIEFTNYRRNHRVRVPGVAANQPGNNVPVNMNTIRPYVSGAIGPTVQIQPPTNLRVNGTTANDGVRMFDGNAPVTVQWNAVTNATRYTVTARRLTTQTVNTTPLSVGGAVTTETSVTLPAAWFAAGERYVFFVTALRDGLPYAQGKLRAGIAPTFAASQNTGVILLSNNCGNGTLNTGEECDTTGQSATCDVDCSLPVCGDGMLNTAAGEQCDPGQGTPTCDISNCTLVTCGDATINRFAGEQCDDGNPDDGDGCDHTCRFENACGDGITQTIYGEDCDDQNAVNTDSCINCKEAFCSDGFVQAGVEMCDDGNFVNGDGCNDQCVPD
jgi:cysteine-rich repeat protein